MNHDIGMYVCEVNTNTNILCIDFKMESIFKSRKKIILGGNLLWNWMISSLWRLTGYAFCAVEFNVMSWAKTEVGYTAWYGVINVIIIMIFFLDNKIIHPRVVANVWRKKQELFLVALVLSIFVHKKTHKISHVCCGNYVLHCSY